MTAFAQSASSATGRMSGEGTPRAKEITLIGASLALPGGPRADQLGDELCGLRRGRADTDAVRLERLLLRCGGAGGAGDDRARVAHRLPRRRGEAGDVPDDRLRHPLADEGGCLLLLRPADLADHDDALGLGVGLELCQDVDEGRADDGVAADPDDRRLADSELGELVPDLVGERAGAA